MSTKLLTCAALCDINLFMVMFRSKRKVGNRKKNDPPPIIDYSDLTQIAGIFEVPAEAHLDDTTDPREYLFTLDMVCFVYPDED